MRTPYRKLFWMVVITIFTACSEIPLDLFPDGNGDPSDVVPTNYYAVNGEMRAIKSIGMYESADNSGYNLVMSDGVVDLCGGYDKKGNRSFSLLNIDFASFTEGRDIVIGEDEISDESWEFYITEWDTALLKETFSTIPESGTYRIDVDDKSIKIELDLTFPEGLNYQVHYEGAYSHASEYIWCEMYDGGSFSVQGCDHEVESAKLFHDASNYGYELMVSDGDQVVAVDFSGLLIGNKCLIGEDDVNPKADNNSVWEFRVTTANGEDKVTYLSLDDMLVSGYVDCQSLTDDRIDFDVAVVTNDGQKLELHYHGLYSEGQHYQKKPVR